MRIIYDYNIGKYFTFQPSKKKPVYNWFYYKEAFSPEVVDYCLNLSGGVESIYDPFMGIGTTLLRAKELGIYSIGRDVNPVAFLASYVKTRNYFDDEIEEVKSFLNSLRTEEPSIKWRFEFFPPERAFPPRNFKEILSIREQIEYLKNEKIKNFLLLALLSVLPMSSYVVKDGGVLKINKRKRTAKAVDVFKRKVKRMIRESSLIRGKEPDIYLESSINKAEKADVVITSPPYLNNVSYANVYGLELSLLFLDESITKKVRGMELNSFIKKKTTPQLPDSFTHLPIVSNYFSDMRNVLENIKASRAAFFVVGNAIINNEHILVDEILSEIAEDMGFEATIIVGLVRKTRINGFLHKVRESLVYLKK